MDAREVSPALAARRGPAATLDLVDLIDRSERQCVETMLTQSVERFERRLGEEVSSLRVDVIQGHATLRQEIAGQKADLLKWSFLFWTGQMIALAGIVAMLLNR